MKAIASAALLAALSLHAPAQAAPADARPDLGPDWTDEAHVPRYACVRNFYVDPAAGRPSSAYGPEGGDAAHPWRSIQDADGAMSGSRPVLRGGDCVNLAPGRYDLVSGVRLTHGGERNAADGYVVYRSTARHGAWLVAAGQVYSMIDIKTAYVVLDGLEIDGADAKARGEGVAASGDGEHHHIVVEHCLIHGTGGGGVQLNDSEYFWIVGNEIWGTASTNRYQESGISTYQPQAARGAAPSAADDIPYHIVILGNVSRDNRETFACADKPGCHTDGNGIIVDKTKNVDRKGGTPYAGRILVAGNRVSGNGGGGVHLYLSQHVTVAGNVAMNNHLDPDNGGTWRGELSNADSDDNLWIGNIGWAKRGPGVLAHNSAVLIASSTAEPAGRNVTWRGNTTCGGDPSVYAHAPGLDPKDNRLDTDPEACRRLIAERRSPLS